VLAAPAVTWLIFRATTLLPARLRIRAPTFFINGRRHYGSYDIAALTAAVLAAKAASVPATGSRRPGETEGDPRR
jgi:hypothetical protein